MTVPAALYDLVMAAAERAFVHRWRCMVVTPATGTIVEIGAGTGLTFSYYTSRAFVIATDRDAAMLARARARAERAVTPILLVAADAEALPFQTGAFDGAVINLALCTISRPERALAELRRATRPGGIVQLLERVRAGHPVIRRLQQWLTPAWRRVAGGCRLDRDSIAAVERSGLRIVGLTTHAGGCVVEFSACVPHRGA
jgi:ubiquinone/menaquinone biosynthesis C-methylase UbiE